MNNDLEKEYSKYGIDLAEIERIIAEYTGSPSTEKPEEAPAAEAAEEKSAEEPAVEAAEENAEEAPAAETAEEKGEEEKADTRKD